MPAALMPVSASGMTQTSQHVCHVELLILSAFLPEAISCQKEA